MPNTDDGVALFNGATDNTIGGTVTGAGNVLSGNDRFGVYLNGSGTSGNVVQGNLIGVNTAGSVLGNTFDGVAVSNGAADNTLGGTASGAATPLPATAATASIWCWPARRVTWCRATSSAPTLPARWSAATPAPACSSRAAPGQHHRRHRERGRQRHRQQRRHRRGHRRSGSDTTTVGDAVLGNAIYDNVGLGIDLGDDGVTANGPGGAARSGPNDLQNYPVFTPPTVTVASNSAGDDQLQQPGEFDVPAGVLPQRGDRCTGAGADLRGRGAGDHRCEWQPLVGDGVDDGGNGGHGGHGQQHGVGQSAGADGDGGRFADGDRDGVDGGRRSDRERGDTSEFSFPPAVIGPGK